MKWICNKASHCVVFAILLFPYSQVQILSLGLCFQTAQHNTERRKYIFFPLSGIGTNNPSIQAI
jgi:hypothetical protein